MHCLLVLHQQNSNTGVGLLCSHRPISFLVVIKFHMVYQREKNFNAALYYQEVVEALNELISKTSETQKSARKFLRVLDDYGVDCVNATEDKGIVFWLRCRNANALIRLQEIDSSGELLRLLNNLLHSLTSFQEHWSTFLEAKLTVEEDNFKKEP